MMTMVLITLVADQFPIDLMTKHTVRIMYIVLVHSTVENALIFEHMFSLSDNNNVSVPSVEFQVLK